MKSFEEKISCAIALLGDELSNAQKRRIRKSARGVKFNICTRMFVAAGLVISVAAAIILCFRIGKSNVQNISDATCPCTEICRYGKSALMERNGILIISTDAEYPEGAYFEAHIMAVSARKYFQLTNVNLAECREHE